MSKKTTTTTTTTNSILTAVAKGFQSGLSRENAEKAGQSIARTLIKDQVKESGLLDALLLDGHKRLGSLGPAIDIDATMAEASALVAAERAEAAAARETPKGNTN